MPTGVISGPFRPILLRFTLSIAACGIPKRPSGFYKGKMKRFIVISLPICLLCPYKGQLKVPAHPNWSHIDRLPFDGHIGNTEDFLHRSGDLGSDTVARDQCHLLVARRKGPGIDRRLGHLKEFFLNISVMRQKGEERRASIGDGDRTSKQISSAGERGLRRRVCTT